jgi:Fic family protein
MHLEERKVGKRTKYFLAHSYREGSRIHKFRKYLGQDLTPALLKERKTIAEKLILEDIHNYNIIKDPLQIQLGQKDIDAIKKLEAHLSLKIRHLLAADWRTFSELFTYNTNAIEGSTLNQKEVKELLEEDKWPDKSKEDIAEAFGVDEAIRFIRGTKEHVSLALIKQIHHIVFKNSKPFAGKLRKKGEEVVVMNSNGIIVHEGAPQARILHLLRQLVAWYETHKNLYPGLSLGAVVHNQFENIHPFCDGNGGVGRILLNNILIKHHLPPLNIDLRNRQEYYASLQAYDHQHDLKPTLNLLLKEYRALQKQLGDYTTTKR